MTTTPFAHQACQCCGRSGTGEFVSVGTDCWECTNYANCRRRSIEAARRQKAARAPLAELPTLLGDGDVDTDGDEAWFEIDTAGNRETVDVEYHPNEEHPFYLPTTGESLGDRVRFETPRRASAGRHVDRRTVTWLPGF